ncbi:ABC transporter permease [Pseudonocardia sp. HH130630-07]|uniref:ABC transporter permease n=1 Tax=Pseudonocardia sp. HH130630-07 TaxID=1690815 RepID=UPI00081522E4|nr:ABC transporter permease [Pseudonocardia sp. HH130630-07]ANY07835.1 peptide ABC transporter permease [Pseudonocardia sp. HH130630-07]
MSVVPDVPARPSLLRRMCGTRLAVPALVVLGLVVLAAALADVIAPWDPNAQDLLVRLQPPGPGGGHPLGTDALGRDVLSRLIHGARVSLLVGIAAALVSGVAGAVVGLVAGARGGRTDRILMGLADVQLAFPGVLVALAVVAFVGNGLWIVIAVLGVTNWVSYARVVRSSVLSLREREFVLGARAIGVGPVTIMRRHLLPNVMAPLATVATLNVAAAILAESALSFLGLGVPASVPTWGLMLSEGQLYLGTAWWIAVFPGLALLCTALAVNVTGDALRGATDPKVYRR